MKILAALIIALLLIFSAMSLVTSTTAPVSSIAYGDVTSGFLNDEIFEWVYEFEGTTGELVLIELQTQDATDNLEPHIYMLSPDGSHTYENNFFTYRQTGLLLELDTTGTYLIVVERNGGRRSDGAGRFELSLNLVDTSTLASSWQGILEGDLVHEAHLFRPKHTGMYRISTGRPYSHNPALKIVAIIRGQGDFPIVAEIVAATMGRTSFEMQLYDDTTYILMPYRHGYQHPEHVIDNSSAMPYSIRITPVGESPSWSFPNGQLTS